MTFLSKAEAKTSVDKKSQSLSAPIRRARDHKLHTLNLHLIFSAAYFYDYGPGDSAGQQNQVKRWSRISSDTFMPKLRRLLEFFSVPYISLTCLTGVLQYHPGVCWLKGLAHGHVTLRLMGKRLCNICGTSVLRTLPVSIDNGCPFFQRPWFRKHLSY